MIEVDHTDELLKALHCLWLCKRSDGLHLFGKRRNARTLDPVAQEVELLHAELAFGQINGEAGSFQTSEHLTQVSKMFAFGLAGDEDVV